MCLSQTRGCGITYSGFACRSGEPKAREVHYPWSHANPKGSAGTSPVRGTTIVLH